MGFDRKRLETHVAAAGDELMRVFGLRTIGGWRAKDPYPDHPGGPNGLGDALDLMTNDIGGPKVSNPIGDTISSYLIANSARLGVKYIIWNGRSWNSSRKTWEKYSGSNPHTDHVHVTFFEQGGTGGPAVPVGDLNATPTGIVGKMFDIDGFMQKAQGTTVTLSAGLLGVALIGVGLVLAVRSTVGKAVTQKLGGWT